MTFIPKAAPCLGNPEATALVRRMLARTKITPLGMTSAIRFWNYIGGRMSTKIVSENVETTLSLARTYLSQGHLKLGAKLLEELLASEKRSPRVWLQYAQTIRYSYDFPVGAENDAFERAAECVGSDFLVLEIVAQYFLEQLSFDKARKYYARLTSEQPRALENPVTCRDYARCLRSCGQSKLADEITRIGLDRCYAMAAVSAGEDLEIVKREEARLLDEAGRTDEAVAVLQSIRALGSPAGPNYERPEYLRSTSDRLERLRNLIAGRDVIVFLQGPSFADFAAQMDDLTHVDFIAATINTFPPVEKELRCRLGRGADLLMITNPQTVRTWHDELQEFVARQKPRLLLASHYAFSNLQEQGGDAQQFVRQHDARLLFAYPGGGPPLPSRPLHFESYNSLSFLLPLLVMGGSQRIFIVGADGGGHPKFKRPYFYYDDIDTSGPTQDFPDRPDLYSYKNRPERLQEANRRLLIGARECDRMVLTSFLFLKHVFDVPIPPVFNVCPHSTHRAFPRIDATSAIAMLRSYAEGHDASRGDTLL